MNKDCRKRIIFFIQKSVWWDEAVEMGLDMPDLKSLPDQHLLDRLEEAMFRR